MDASVVHTPAGYHIGHATQVPSGVRLSAPARLVIGKGADIDGGVFSAGSVFTQDHVTVRGPLRAAGIVVIGAFTRIGGDVEAGSDCRLLPEAFVLGQVRAAGDVHLFDGAIVEGGVTAGGDIVLWGTAKTGTLRPGGRLVTEAFPRPEPEPAARSGGNRTEPS